MKVVSSRFPGLSRPQARVLALWSFGMVVAQSCGLTSVAGWLASLLGKKEDALRQPLREWCYEAADKRGLKRQAIRVEACFVPLVQWVLSWWPQPERRLAGSPAGPETRWGALALAMDATTLGQRFVVLCLSVVYRGCAIPVAWAVVPANQKGAWRPYWEPLYRCLHHSIPTDWTVIVLADRGLYAPWLFIALTAMGWHPFLRINSGGKCRPEGERQWRGLETLVPRPGSAWSGRLLCFKQPSSRLTCTLLARWDEGYQHPWLVLTDLAPQQAEVAWYGMRPWVEAGFQDLKRGGWQWQQTRRHDPQRASRLWLAIAVATLWTVSVGGRPMLLCPPVPCPTCRRPISLGAGPPVGPGPACAAVSPAACPLSWRRLSPAGLSRWANSSPNPGRPPL